MVFFGEKNICTCTKSFHETIVLKISTNGFFFKYKNILSIKYVQINKTFKTFT